jgi:hypothetical protein
MNQKEHTVPCIWCGTPTAYTGTKQCDACHELDKRISDSPELAARIVGYYSAQQGITQTKIVSDVLDGRYKAKFKNDQQAGYINHSGTFVPFVKDDEK